MEKQIIKKDGYETIEKNIFSEHCTMYYDENKNFHHYDQNIPAFVYNGFHQHYDHGILHRLTGPAVYSNNSKFEKYYLFGRQYEKEEYYEIINNPEKLQNLFKMKIIMDII